MLVLETISCNSTLRIRPLEVESSFGSKGVLNRKNLTYGVKQPRVSLGCIKRRPLNCFTYQWCNNNFAHLDSVMHFIS